MPVSFSDPIEVTRSKRPWTELYPKAVLYVDALLDAFEKNAKGKPEGYARLVNGIDIPLDRDSENPDTRAVRLINERFAGRGNKCHAAMRSSKIHFIVGPKTVIKRTRKPKEDNGTADAE